MQKQHHSFVRLEDLNPLDSFPKLLSTKATSGNELDYTAADFTGACLMNTLDGITLAGFILWEIEGGGRLVAFPCRLPVGDVGDEREGLYAVPLSPAPVVEFSASYIESVSPIMFETEHVYYKYILDILPDIIPEKLLGEFDVLRKNLTDRISYVEENLLERSPLKESLTPASPPTMPQGMEALSANELPQQVVDMLESQGIDSSRVEVVKVDMDSLVPPEEEAFISRSTSEVLDFEEHVSQHKKNKKPKLH